MAGIGDMLQIGRSALLGHQARMETIQNNVANASTDGYTRQRVDMVTLGGTLQSTAGRGVHASDPNAIRSPFFDRQIPVHQAEFGFHSSRVQVEGAMEATLYPEGGPHLADRVSEFFGGLQTLSARPSDPVARRDMVESAREMAAGFRRDSRAITEQQASVRSAAFGRVDQLNGTLDRIAELDAKIEQSSASQQPNDDLIDERNRLVTSVTESLDVRVVKGENDTVQLFTRSGHALVQEGRAHHLELSDNAGALELSVAGAVADASVDQPGGSLGGMIHSHNDVLQGQLEELDRLAFEFASEFNAVHRGGVGLDGNGGRDFFAVGNQQGAAASLAVDSDIVSDPSRIAAASGAGGLPGGNDNLQALAALQETALPGGGTLGEGLREMRQNLGAGIASAQNRASTASSSLAQLEGLQSSVEGVSLEEEMVALTEAQRGFEAATKVMQATDQMFDTIMTLKR